MSHPILPRYRRHPFLTEDGLRGPLRPPPGIYEWTSAERFGELMATGHFNVVIIFLWFWYDPQPSAAELMLPLIRAHAPADRQPFVDGFSGSGWCARAAFCAAGGSARRAARRTSISFGLNLHEFLG